MPAMPPELEKIISTGGEKIESMSPEMEKHILEMVNIFDANPLLVFKMS